MNWLFIINIYFLPAKVVVYLQGLSSKPLCIAKQSPINYNKKKVSSTWYDLNATLQHYIWNSKKLEALSPVLLFLLFLFFLMCHCLIFKITFAVWKLPPKGEVRLLPVAENDEQLEEFDGDDKEQVIVSTTSLIFVWNFKQ